jgi:hypothetical protein
MYVCMYVCIYVCIHVCMYVCMYGVCQDSSCPCTDNLRTYCASPSNSSLQQSDSSDETRHFPYEAVMALTTFISCCIHLPYLAISIREARCRHQWWYGAIKGSWWTWCGEVSIFDRSYFSVVQPAPEWHSGRNNLVPGDEKMLFISSVLPVQFSSPALVINCHFKSCMKVGVDVWGPW